MAYSSLFTAIHSAKHTHLAKHLAAAGALALLLTAAAQAETFPAVPTSTLPPKPTAAVSPTSLDKPRPASADVPFAGLSIQPQQGTALPYANQASRDFGTLSPLDTPNVQALFRLKNETDKPILLDRLQPSCHCTHVEAIPVQTGALIVAPGQTLTLHVTVDLAGHPAGGLEKSVSIYVPGQTQPAALLLMRATLTPLVSLTPTLLDFGVPPAGKPEQRTITVTVDPRLASGGSLPALRSSSPFVRLLAQPVIVTATTAAQPASTPLTRTYSVILSPDTPIGPINGVLSFAPPAGGSADAAQTFAGSSVLFMGQVKGEVGALPQSLAFGPVKQGEEAIRQIALTGNTAGDVKELRVASPSLYISAHLLPLSPSFGVGNQLVTNVRTLVVTLSPQAPAGTMQTQLRVSLASGRRLVIPITAYVSAPVSY